MDATYLLVIIGMVLCLGAGALVNSTMGKYSRVRSSTGLTGAEAARRILNNEGLYQVQIECLSSESGDHYDPRTNTVRLSRGNYSQPTVTAVGVAAHECGHAIQHAKGYSPLKFRTALVPAANIGSKLGIPIVILGLILGSNSVLINIGIWVFALAVLFQIVTLPVEFDASRRALVCIEQYGIVTGDERAKSAKVLRAAAYTYVAAAAASVLQLLRLVLLSGRRRD